MAADNSSSSGERITANEEVRLLPKGWEMKGTGASNRVAFYRSSGPQADKTGTFDHPLLGALRHPWELRKRGQGQFVYYNTETRTAASRGPRKVSRQPSANPPPGSVAVRGSGQHGKLRRQQVSLVPLHDSYERVRCLDDGTGAIGGMNSGIYVVRKKLTGQLFVEKNYSGAIPHLIPFIKSEINMMKDLIHSSIIHYVASFVQDNPFQATVYMEYCDRGSLRDLILTYKARKKAHLPDFIPESFIWHAFVGLSDALGFLATGQSYASLPMSLHNSSVQHNTSSSSWVPIVHRDIKPDNVFLRSRDTPGSAKPLYVLLSDFGLAQHESPTAAAAAMYPASPSLLQHSLVGSPEYHAPELAFDPYPATDALAQTQQAAPHSGRSDVWALACVVFCMCERDDLAHLDRNCRPLRSRRAVGRAAKRPVLELSSSSDPDPGSSGSGGGKKTGAYSGYLGRCVAWAGCRDPARRPGGWELVREVARLRDAWLEDPGCGDQVDRAGALPWWAAEKRVV